MRRNLERSNCVKIGKTMKVERNSRDDGSGAILSVCVSLY